MKELVCTIKEAKGKRRLTSTSYVIEGKLLVEKEEEVKNIKENMATSLGESKVMTTINGDEPVQAVVDTQEKVVEITVQRAHHIVFNCTPRYKTSSQS